MKKLTSISAVILFCVAFLSPLPVSLANATLPPPAYPMTCHTFYGDLKFGDSGNEVTALAQILQKEDEFPFSTGQFDENVAAAVVHFQAKYGIRQTGYFGPISRAKINALYGCGQEAVPVSVGPFERGCFAGALFNILTGARCGVPAVASPCGRGALFNSLTGEKCGSTSLPYVTPSTGSVSSSVKCVFSGSSEMEKCYRATNDISLSVSCSGIGTCMTDVHGPIGTSLTWKSSCGGYAYTTINGENQYAKFDCGEADFSNGPTVISNPKTSVTVLSPNGGEVWTPGSGVGVKFAASGLVGKEMNIFAFNGDENGNYQLSLNVPIQYNGNDADAFTLPSGLPSGTHYKVYVEVFDPVTGSGVLASDYSDDYITITSNTPTTPTGSLSISPSSFPNPILSGGLVTLSFTTHTNAAEAKLYLYCPPGVTSSFGTGGADFCNTWYAFPMIPSGSTFRLINTTNQAQNVVPNFYEYLSDNQNYGTGVSTQITVQPGNFSQF